MIAQSDIIASNGMIHIINKLMDSVAATVESNAQVRQASCFVFWTHSFTRS